MNGGPACFSAHNLKLSEAPRPKGGASQKPCKIVWGNLSPNPPKMDVIHPRAKHEALWHALVEAIALKLMALAKKEQCR